MDAGGPRRLAWRRHGRAGAHPPLPAGGRLAPRPRAPAFRRPLFGPPQRRRVAWGRGKDRGDPGATGSGGTALAATANIARGGAETRREARYCACRAGRSLTAVHRCSHYVLII